MGVEVKMKMEKEKAKRQNHCFEQLYKEGSTVQQPHHGPQFNATYKSQD